MLLPVVLLLLGPAAAWGQPYGFVTSAAENKVAVVNLGNDTLVGSFPLDGLPSGSDLSANGNHLFVVRTQANSLAKIDLVNGSVTMIPVGAGPAGVWSDPFFPAFVYVANASGDSVSVVNPWSGVPSVVATVPVGDSPLAVTGVPGRVYVANWGADTVSVVDTFTSGFPVVGTVAVGSFPAGLALDATAGRLYVANFLDDTVSVVDTATLAVTATIQTCARPRGMAVAAGRLYVACFDESAINAIDTATNQVVLEAPSGATNPLDVALGPGGQRLYVVHMQEGKSITVLDAATLAPLRAIDAPAGPVTFAGFGNQAPPLGTGKLGLFRRAAAALAEAWPRQPVPRAVVRPSRAAAAAAVEILDTEFDVNHWDVLNQVGAQTTTQETAGGNPGAWRRTLPLELDTRAYHRYIGPGAVWDPAVQGALATIDWTWDRKVEGEEINTVIEELVVFQDGTAYRRQTGALPTTWESVSRVGLTAPFFDDGQGGTPDFSASGSPLTFGYWRRNFFQVAHGIDNFRLLLYPPGAGVLSFQRSADLVVNGEWLDVTVERQGGTVGAVTASLGGADEWDPCACVSWADGDGSPQLVRVRFFLGDSPTGGSPPAPVFTTDLRLFGATGGATIDRGTMLVQVWPQVSGELGALFQILVEIVRSGFSPLWLLALAVPTGLLAIRRRRHSRQARASAARRASAMPTSVPAREP